MGRHRKIFDKHDLPPRVYLHHGSYRYHPREGKRIPLGKDYGEAMRLWASIVKPVTDLGTVSALIDWYLINVAPKKAPRTYADNKKEAEYLKKGLGHIPYTQLKPHHVATYRDERGQDAPVQRPDDLIKAGPASIKRIDHEGREIRVLRIQQGKTGKTVDIILAGDLEKLVDEHLSAKTVWPTFVHTRVGKKCTYSGLVAMFGRYVRKEKLTDFGMYDLKGKGATDMYRSGTPIERIQHLLGHESVTTTEIYIKARLPDISMPNMREMAEKEVAPLTALSVQRK